MRSTFFPYRQHFVDRSPGAAIRSTKLPLAPPLNAAVDVRRRERKGYGAGVGSAVGLGSGVG
jgi:hypothetical protein